MWAPCVSVTIMVTFVYLLQPTKTFTTMVESANKEATVESDNKEAMVEPANIQATVEPANKEATLEPANIQAKVEPANKEATLEPANKEATLEPANKEAKVESANKEAKVEPANIQAKVEPANKEATLEPANKQSAVEPATKRATVEPANIQAAVASANKQSAVAPATKRATVESHDIQAVGNFDLMNARNDHHRKATTEASVVLEGGTKISNVVFVMVSGKLTCLFLPQKKYKIQCSSDIRFLELKNVLRSRWVRRVSVARVDLDTMKEIMFADLSFLLELKSIPEEFKATIDNVERYRRLVILTNAAVRAKDCCNLKYLDKFTVFSAKFFTNTMNLLREIFLREIVIQTFNDNLVNLARNQEAFIEAGTFEKEAHRIHFLGEELVKVKLKFDCRISVLWVIHDDLVESYSDFCTEVKKNDEILRKFMG